MSFDFGTGTNNDSNNDPTSEFVSKFPDLDAADADVALTAAVTGVGAGAGAGPVNTRTSTGGWGGLEDDDDDDLLGGGGGGGSTTTAHEKPKDEREAFESTFPELQDPELQDDGAMEAQPTAYAPPPSTSNGFLAPTSGTQVPGRGPSPSLSFDPSSTATATAGAGAGTSTNRYSTYEEEEEEPEPIREWRHRQGDEIATRDAAGERKKAEAVSQAERDIDQFYKEYNAKKEKSIKRNKEVEAEFAEKRSRELAEGTTWDRITRLIELQNSQSKTIAPGGPGSTDLSRFRELLLSLRREGETAPAAGGY